MAETASVAETARSLAPILNTWPRAPSADDLILEFGADLMVENLSPRTIRNYLADLFALARHVGKPMDALTTEDLQEYLRSQIARGLSVASRARHVGSVRRFYDWLRRTRHLPGSIAQDLRPIKRTKSLHRWWTTEQVAQFRTAFQTPEVLLTGRARGTEPRTYQLAEPRVVVARDRAMCELGLMGLRVSEVTNLDLADIVSLDDSDRATLLVKRKGRKDQALPIVADARTALRRWLRVRPRVPAPYLFIRLPFQPARPARLHYESVGRILEAYAERAGLSLPQGKMFHHLRHTAGQQMAELGYGIEEAQAFLGHESPETTQIYYEVTNRRLRDVSRRFRYGRRRDRP